MISAPDLERARRNGLAALGEATRRALTNLGAAAVLALAAPRSLVWTTRGAPALWPALTRQMAWVAAAGLPLVGLVHVGMGSYLAMQAFFGATFVDGASSRVGDMLLLRDVSGDDREDAPESLVHSAPSR